VSAPAARPEFLGVVVAEEEEDVPALASRAASTAAATAACVWAREGVSAASDEGLV
jgi:hypothetical protein